MTDTNIQHAQKLAPDGEVTLFELTTRGGTTIYIKNGPDVTYLGNLYEGIPVNLGAEKRSVEGSNERPTFTIGGDDVDLSSLKPALYSGLVDGGVLVKHIVQVEDLKANNNVKITSQYRIKQIQSYNRTNINMILARFSPSTQTTIPYRKYTRPAFPYVKL